MECMGPAYAQDVIAPVKVVHDLHFGDRQGDMDFGHFYNFLGYVFAEGESYAEAVHYMDEPDRVTVRILRPAGFEGAFARKVLMFLSARYDSILVRSEAGAGDMDLPSGVLQEILAARDAHMNAFD